MEKYTVEYSHTTQVHIVLSGDIGTNGRLFGGRFMEWIDIVAAVTARRHCGCDVTTAMIDKLEFRAPAFSGDNVVLDSRVIYTGNTSMEVRVDSYVERLDHSRELINIAYLTMVAMNDDGNPIRVPKLITLTDAERAEFEAARSNAQRRKAERNNP